MAFPAESAGARAAADLAPDIVAAILDDALQNHLTLFDLAVEPPELWDERRRGFGMDCQSQMSARICVSER